VVPPPARTAALLEAKVPARVGKETLLTHRRHADGSDFNSEIMTLHDLARYLVCSYMTAFRLVRRGELRAFRLGSRIGSDWRVWRVDVEEWIAKQETGPRLAPERKQWS
jgi:excisionase family DNA binding protein